MEYSLQFTNSEGNRAGFPNNSFEPYIDEISENHIPITCSQQHLTYENTRNISTQVVNNENSTNMNEYNSCDSINPQNSYLELKDTSHLTTFRRSSLRGRRRYRRTLLRNYEQSFGLNNHTNINYLDIGEEPDINTQKRVFLRNTNITGNGIGTNHSNLKYNTNYDQFNKVNKPSWDGGRLVKLLQGHGLNIDNYEKENDRLMNRNWNSKQISAPVKHHEESNLFKDVNYTQIKNEENYLHMNEHYNNNLKSSVLLDHSYQKLGNIKGIPFQGFRSNNDQFQQNIEQNSLPDGIESIKLNIEKQQINQSEFFVQEDFAVENKYQVPNAEQKLLISDIRYYSGNHQNNMNNNKINMNNQNDISKQVNEYIDNKNFVDLFFDNSRQNLTKNNQISTNNNLENISNNVNNQIMFNLEDLEDESISNLISYPSNSFFNTSHEELFVTLGDTPTSKSSYNISSLFIPNQDT